MTAEVAVLNKHGVALAADSAVTVAGRKTYNSANKLFSLSASDPVGVMVYNSAEIDSVPWETILKEFRRKREAPRPLLHEYYEELMAFIQGGAGGLMPVEGSRMTLVGTFAEVAAAVANRSERLLSERVSTMDPVSIAAIRATQRVVVGECVAWLYELLEKRDFLPGFTQEDAQALRTEYDREIQDAFEAFSLVGSVLETETREQLATACSWALTKNWDSPRSSGIVVAGFGADEPFPSLIHAKVWGSARGKLRVSGTEAVAITPQNPGEVLPFAPLPFAQQEMVHAFMTGVDSDLLTDIGGALQRLMVGTLPGKVAAGFPEEQRAVIESRIREAGEAAFQELGAWIKGRCGDGNARRIIAAVGVLAKEDLAMLAESLVNLTSLKRRVTLDTETVGGPIDVAVISRGDGFIWMRRKHYFQPALNPRYFARISGKRQE